MCDKFHRWFLVTVWTRWKWSALGANSLPFRVYLGNGWKLWCPRWEGFWPDFRDGHFGTLCSYSSSGNKGILICYVRRLWPDSIDSQLGMPCDFVTLSILEITFCITFSTFSYPPFFTILLTISKNESALVRSRYLEHHHVCRVSWKSASQILSSLAFWFEPAAPGDPKSGGGTFYHRKSYPVPETCSECIDVVARTATTQQRKNRKTRKN